MNKYVSPIIEIELIDVEDILMSGDVTEPEEPEDPSTPGLGGDELPPIDLGGLIGYFN